MTEHESRINVIAAERISSAPAGGYLLEIFKGMEAQMVTMQSQGQFSQLSFIGSPDELKPGDLIPELHFSLREYVGEVIEEDEDTNEGE
jgi:hypothetical protein